MRTVLGIVIGLGMILTVGSVASAADLMTPLVFSQGYACVVVNLDDKPIEIEVTNCDNLVDPYSLRCTSLIETIAAGEIYNPLVGGVLKTFYAMCKFSFKGSSSIVRAGIKNATTADYILVPAE